MLRCLGVVVLAALAAGPLDAQRRPARRPAAASGPRMGLHLGYNFDGEAALLGAQAAFPLAPRVDLYPSFDFYFVSGYSLWALNVDARYRPPTRLGLFYFGGGINYLRQSNNGFGNSNTNLNIVGGIESRRRRAAPYLELRLTVGDGSTFQMVGGFSWRM